MAGHGKSHSLGSPADHTATTKALLNDLVSDDNIVFESGSNAISALSATFDSGIELSGNIVFEPVSGVGIQFGYDPPTFGWRDITSAIQTQGQGATDPVWTTFFGNINAFQFQDDGDQCWVDFHIPHDYVPGSELYIHTHWGLNVLNTTSTLTWGFDATFCERDDIAPNIFPATTNKLVSHDCSAIPVSANTHVVSEVQLTSGGGFLNDRQIEVDGIILCRIYLADDAAGAVNPFLFFVDIHYQSSNLATKNRAPNFYG
jgi:hypothetical protein